MTEGSLSQLLFVFLTATSRVKKVDIISGREGEGRINCRILDVKQYEAGNKN